MSTSKIKLEKDFYPNSDLTDEIVSHLKNDPRFFQDEFGFHRCLSETELKKMSEKELTHLIFSCSNEKDVANAKCELNRRNSLREHRLNLRDNIVGGIIGGTVVAIVQCVVKFLTCH